MLNIVLTLASCIVSAWVTSYIVDLIGFLQEDGDILQDAIPTHGSKFGLLNLSPLITKLLSVTPLYRAPDW